MGSVFKNVASDMPVEDVRTRMKAHFAKQGSNINQKWDELWDQNFIPWDRSMPNPALEDSLQNKVDLLPFVKRHDGSRPKALVPGTGRGYDVLLLASFGYDAYGLDVSEKAIEASKAYEKSDGHRYPARNADRGKGSVTWICADFFSKDWSADSDFDLIFDYTFTCAMEPRLRPKISARFNELLSQTGRLICLEFPSTKPPSAGGPPFAMPEKVYLGYLQRPGEDLPVDEVFDLQEDKLNPPSEKGLKRIDRWLASRTHKIGEGIDHVSVWTHRS